jgi:hypothetical protein
MPLYAYAVVHIAIVIWCYIAISSTFSLRFPVLWQYHVAAACVKWYSEVKMNSCVYLQCTTRHTHPLS